MTCQSRCIHAFIKVCTLKSSSSNKSLKVEVKLRSKQPSEEDLNGQKDTQSKKKSCKLFHKTLVFRAAKQMNNMNKSEMENECKKDDHFYRK